MRNKNKTKDTFPPPHPFFPVSTSPIHSQLLYFLPTPSSAGETGNGGLWSVHKTSSLPLLPHNFSLLQHIHRIQAFTNCSSMGPFHGVQSFRNGLLQHRSPTVTGPARKPAPVWAPLHGPQFLPGARSSVGSPRAATSFGAYPPALAWGPPWAAV